MQLGFFATDAATEAQPEDLYDETLAFPSLGVFGLLKGVSVSAASANKCVVRRTALYRSHALRFTQRRISTMSKMRNVVVAFALSVLTVPLAFSQEHGNAGCKNGKFIGSYTHLDTIADVWGDGSNVE